MMYIIIALLILVIVFLVARNRRLTLDVDMWYLNTMLRPNCSKRVSAAIGLYKYACLCECSAKQIRFHSNDDGTLKLEMPKPPKNVNYLWEHDKEMTGINEPAASLIFYEDSVRIDHVNSTIGSRNGVEFMSCYGLDFNIDEAQARKTLYDMLQEIKEEAQKYVCEHIQEIVT